MNPARTAIGLLAAAALALTGCAAGQVAETSQEVATLDGTNENIGSIALRGLSVEAPTGDYYPTGSNPQLVLVIVNDGSQTDRLVKISSSVAGGWAAFASADDAPAPLGDGGNASTPAPPTSSPSGSPAVPTPTAASSDTGTGTSQGSISIAPNESVKFGVPAAAGRVLVLTGTTRRIQPGNVISITFTFARAGSRTLQVPVKITGDGNSYEPSASYLPSHGKGVGAG